jgi:uncharacterized protein YutE (UPF0331/DUF86 family)
MIEEQSRRRPVLPFMSLIFDIINLYCAKLLLRMETYEHCLKNMKLAEVTQNPC